MKVTSNFIRFHDQFGLKKTIDIFSDAGFEGIDFNADLEEYYTDVHNEAFYKNIKKYAQDKGIVFAQTHAPFGSSFTEDEKTKKTVWGNCKKHAAFRVVGCGHDRDPSLHPYIL